MGRHWTERLASSAAFAAAVSLLVPTAGRAAQPLGPRVFSATITPQDIRPRIDVTAQVVTSPNVTDVIARVAGRTITIPRVEAGLFRGTTTTPRFPRFIHLHLEVVFVARDAAGDQVQFPRNVKVN